MKNIKIHIKRTPEQIIEINENQVKFINSVRGKDAFLKKVARDFLRKKKIYEIKRSTQDS